VPTIWRDPESAHEQFIDVEANRCSAVGDEFFLFMVAPVGTALILNLLKGFEVESWRRLHVVQRAVWRSLLAASKAEVWSSRRLSAAGEAAGELLARKATGAAAPHSVVSAVSVPSLWYATSCAENWWVRLATTALRLRQTFFSVLTAGC
jgi:hypothetical protein